MNDAPAWTDRLVGTGSHLAISPSDENALSPEGITGGPQIWPSDREALSDRPPLPANGAEAPGPPTGV